MSKFKVGDLVRPDKHHVNEYWAKRYGGKWPARVTHILLFGNFALEGKSGSWRDNGLELAAPLKLENK